jgi:hypothetical protein
MLYTVISNAKEETPLKEINREREEWIQKGRDKVLECRCKRVDRYEVAGRSPIKIFLVIETDDPRALNILSHHFGDHWHITTYPVIHQGIYEALEEDKTVTCG